MPRSVAPRARRAATLALALALLSLPSSLAAQSRDTLPVVPPTPDCPPCAEWNAPQPPLRLHGNTWYVGTRGLAAILVTSPEGHVLIDGGLPESAPLIIANIRALGFRVQDVRLILNSHAHYDHAGGIALLARESGATVAAHPWSARLLAEGTRIIGDPQYASALPYPPYRGTIRHVADGDTLRVGPLALVAHYTGGHTPGSTTWSWRSCDGANCRDFVYADSQTPISDEGFLYSRNDAYPNAVADFGRGHALLERLACDVLVTPHPAASQLWQRVEARGRGDADALVDREGCRRYAATARRALAQRLERERTTGR